MTQQMQPSTLAPPPPPKAGAIYKVGTLTYTKYGLISLFFWLLWGDLVYTLMEAVMPAVLPLKMESLDAEWLLPIFSTTIVAAMNFIVCPIASFKSDRYRSRMGRRIPYLLWSTPIVCVFLILFGFSDAIGHSLYGPASKLLGFEIGEKTMIVCLMGLCIVGWRFGDSFTATIYSYFFNDVVPDKVITRFMALNSMVAIAGNFFYQVWIFPRSMDYFSHIFVIAGLLYLIGFSLMCLKVKEGQYPPPPENIDKRKGFISSCKTYAKECFTHKFYWYFFLMNTCLSCCWLSGVYGVLRNKTSLHLDLQTLGMLGGATTLVTFLISYPLGWLGDKLNPIRVFVIMGFVMFLNPLSQCVFIFFDFGTTGNTWFLLIQSLLILPMDTLQGTVERPMYMKLLPRERFGQFCSANGTIRALARILLSLVVTVVWKVLFDHLGKETAYRLYPLWTVAFYIPAMIFMYLLYREFNRMGGTKGYVPPSA